MHTASILTTTASCIALAGCMSVSRSSEPIVVVSPAPSRPHLILTADRSSLRHGESVKIIATFVNPTKHRVALPTTSQFDDDPSIEHRLQIDWKGENGSSRSGLSAVGINACPPSIDYLEPKTSRSYHLQWKFDERDKGVVKLIYQFGYSDDFPPATITLRTH